MAQQKRDTDMITTTIHVEHKYEVGDEVRHPDTGDVHEITAVKYTTQSSVTTYEYLVRDFGYVDGRRVDRDWGEA